MPYGNSRLPLVEPVAIQEVFVDGAIPPQERGGIVRVVLWALHDDGDGGVAAERRIAVRVAMTAQAFAAMLSVLAGVPKVPHG